MTPKTTRDRIAQMTFASIYPLYVSKIEKKGRTEAEPLELLQWLTGFTKARLERHIEQESTFDEVFDDAELDPNASLITGVIRG